MTGQVRMLFTGGRWWADEDLPARALAETAGDFGEHLVHHDPEHGLTLDWSGITVIHGKCETGLDRIIDRIARELGCRVDGVPAKWPECGPRCDPAHRRVRRSTGEEYCPAAGNRRNGVLVAKQPVVCCGFPTTARWSGTWDCMTKAHKAGIPVRNYGAKRRMADAS